MLHSKAAMTFMLSKCELARVTSSSTPRPGIEGAYEPGMFYSNLKRNSINAIRIETGQIAEGCTQKNLCLLEFGTAK